MPSVPLLPSYVTLEELLQELRALCWGAADILLAYANRDVPPYGFPSALDVEEGVEGPVSAADLAVNSWLLDGLTQQFPFASWSLLSEESAKGNLNTMNLSDEDWIWILDPLDGTKDFLQGTGEYAVHLALVNNHRPVLGVVLVPEAEELWFGVVGFGTWCENRRGERSPVRFSQRKNFQDLILVASKNHRDLKLEGLLRSLDIAGTKEVGSVGCKIATILRGEADIYISLSGHSAPKDWDMAAPEVVLLAAGGCFSHADGQWLQYNTGDFRQMGCLVASHGYIHSEICQAVSKAMMHIAPGFSL